MPLPTTKKELISSLNQAYKKLDDEFETISKKMERLQHIQGNISCCDIVAYQIGWAKLLLNWEEQELNGKNPEMPAKDFKWNQLGELAKSFYARESCKSLSKLRKELKSAVQDLNTWIDSLTECELFQLHQRKWTGDKWAMVKWIQINTIAPYRSARTKVRRWKKDCEI
jgi:hypothetical protein